MSYDDIQYKHPGIAQVILRADYVAHETRIEKGLDKELVGICRKTYPISEFETITENVVELSPGGEHVSTKQFQVPKFLSRTRDKEVKIAPSFIVFDYKAYDTFDRFLSEVLPVIVEFGRVYKEVSFSRVGFRFINRFDFDVQPSKMDWSTYFQSDLVSVEKFIPNAEAVSRLLHLVEFNYEDGLLRFQFGQSNPDHPAPIRRCQFLLDLDAYANGPFDAGDVEPLLEGFHKRIQHLFESSITDALRDKMNGR